MFKRIKTGDHKDRPYDPFGDGGFGSTHGVEILNILSKMSGVLSKMYKQPHLKIGKSISHELKMVHEKHKKTKSA
jgi:hypothetical protein